ncbi:MAG TPA: hypothetical protein VF677_15975 [Flavobacterium sp.]|jgi:antitoxin component YwqK of YwqJK toxin-antitoxin module
MKYLLTFFLFITIVYPQDNFNKKDAAGKRHGVWKGFYEGTQNLRYEGTFEHGIETGTFKYYDNTKEPIVLATREFSQNGTVAYTIFYDKKNKKISEGKTINRLNEGEWKFYHKDADNIMMVENYKEGKLNGPKKVFFKNNAIAEESNYSNGLKDGPYKKYLENGTIIEESNFKNGEYEGVAKFYDAEGKIASKGPFVKGAKKGKWQFYENGKLKKEETYPIVKFIATPKRKNKE